MKAAVIEEWDRPPVYTDHPEPQASGGAVVASVEASPLTNLTRGVAMGKHYASKGFELPVIPGVDGVVRLPDGRRVYVNILSAKGLFAERAAVHPENATPVPDDVDSVTAAALPNPGVSAWISLEHAAAVSPGDHVLVLGATGVTGATAVQLAKSVFGAGRVVAAGRNTERLAWLRSVGADEAITLDELGDRVSALHRERPFDAVLDYLWGPPAEATLAALTSRGVSGYHPTRFVQVGSMAGETVGLSAAVLRSSGITMRGVGLGSAPPVVTARARTEGLPRMFAMLAAGELALPTKAVPLADVEQVWTAPESSGVRIVVTP
ncbi:zinc-binding dehydrogenase family protein [Mycolicibacterium hassiacum DSM 44199]|jgi:NADPH:quinone reductase-like Zn-dependent oxidoreductase|uniref:Zinc-binding dehydrogenase family protein n=1 Tax=Mycolicibacterium hassiacum (strain DSM 44199 / CIP 105218 / JCM 12690 / 3849) TaxID=1122247 RepID=K5BAG8_MYCHD|nr:zinc-binding alcohol dehydrogenase family protein [Mycolicibacterium hassiacum]EKF22215.1 zinc-binding dehydrogenase family protein [Mycolicibacterium hassiacum DSM 44199]MBX5487520.1 zinc-binding alcohol dehydrogenase family protein [Mycolicibacterium hassiacum]MDA4087512.1 alcohol dehydrogenase [Mycolicibacterium hassiacum DSM 44199]PZN21858.1 MAG: alcohol dehydrogenase [Mycolicibacterium hassiacum]VCT91864.1 Phthiocerol/phenolphthiocerol synthesis polyketide synthase type I PpsC [Mycolic